MNNECIFKLQILNRFFSKQCPMTQIRTNPPPFSPKNIFAGFIYMYMLLCPVCFLIFFLSYLYIKCISKEDISIDIGTNNQNIDENKSLVIERQKTPYYTSTHLIRLASRRSISGKSLKCKKLTYYGIIFFLRCFHSLYHHKLHNYVV